MAEYNPSKIIKDGNTYNFRDTTKIPLAGSNQISGSLIPATDNAIDIGSSTKNIKALYTKGITINGTQFLPSDYVPRSGGNVITGTLIGRIDDTDLLYLSGNGGHIVLFGASYAWGQGAVRLNPNLSETSYKAMYLFPNGTWTWDGTACQVTSDQRYKQQINAIDDKLLDAWKDVAPVQFKYNDAVKEKSDNARLHTGYVVQQIDKACKEHGVDVSAYGLYCHEEYPEETEEVEVEQKDGTKTKETKVIREASEHYSLRYTECLVVECAYLRKKNKELQEQLDKLSARLDKLEGVQTK